MGWGIWMMEESQFTDNEVRSISPVREQGYREGAGFPGLHL